MLTLRDGGCLRGRIAILPLGHPEHSEGPPEKWLDLRSRRSFAQRKMTTSFAWAQDIIKEANSAGHSGICCRKEV